MYELHVYIRDTSVHCLKYILGIGFESSVEKQCGWELIEKGKQSKLMICEDAFLLYKPLQIIL